MNTDRTAHYYAGRAAQNRLSDCLYARKMTAGELAKRVGLHRTTVLHYANGDCWPSVPALLAICDALGVSPLDIYPLDR